MPVPNLLLLQWKQKSGWSEVVHIKLALVKIPSAAKLTADTSFRTTSLGKYYLLPIAHCPLGWVRGCFHEAMHDCNHHSNTQVTVMFPRGTIAHIAIITQAAGPLKLHSPCILQFACGAVETVEVPFRKLVSLFAYCKYVSIAVYCKWRLKGHKNKLGFLRVLHQMKITSSLLTQLFLTF